MPPPLSSGSTQIFAACVIARRFAHRIPTPKELQDSFGMSRATAYRWVGAMKAAAGEGAE